MADPAVFLRIGPKGEIVLPENALHALGASAGEQLKLRVDSRHKVLHLERHVDDPWSEALKDKRAPGFEDLLDDQKQRDAEAKRTFEQKLKEKGPAPKPEDRPDHWR